MGVIFVQKINTLQLTYIKGLLISLYGQFTFFTAELQYQLTSCLFCISLNFVSFVPHGMQ